jgi:para-nitrobenzyl esterase
MAMQNRPDPDTRRLLPQGSLIGSREAGDVLAWRGIPYAHAERWRAPQPAVPWSGELQALEHGPVAPQYADLLIDAPSSQRGQVVGDEARCLSLNIFAPARSAAEPRPVMVWIHGGANAVGASSTYDAARNLAREDGLVLVTVNYRLGVLGWFTHPALWEADAASPEERSGNFGSLDLIAALRWVRDHIAVFGGDPECVTVFGESAGGQNVLQLLVSPLANGLFHRAIAQSPVTLAYSVEQAAHWLDDPFPGDDCSAQEVTARLWAQAGYAADLASARAALKVMPAETIAAFLRGLDPAALMAAYQRGTAGFYLGPRPVLDGVVLPRESFAERFASGTWNRVPVIIGSNRDEFKTFVADKPEHVRLLPGGLPLLRNRRAYLAETACQSRVWKALHVDAVADAMLAGGHKDVWTYRFDWDEAPAVPLIRPDLLLGAAHAMEMAFVFRDVTGELDIFKVFTPFNRRGRRQLAAAMGDAWTSFARAGEPRLTTDWWRRRLDSHLADTLVFDTSDGGGVRMERLREQVEDVKRTLHADTSLDAALRCRIYARVFLWNPLFSRYGSADEYERWSRELGHAEPAAHFRPRIPI